jgi:hypothetical protein
LRAYLEGDEDGADDDLDLDELDLGEFADEWHREREAEFYAVGEAGQVGQVADDALEFLLSPCDLLAPYRVPVKVSEAIAYLESILDPVRILALFQHYFPVAFKNTQAKMVASSSNTYSDAEIEFFRLVDTHLFPLWDYILEWQLEEEIREMAIPVAPQAMEVWDRDMDDFRHGWHVLFILEGVKAVGDLPEDSPYLIWREELEAFSRVPGEPSPYYEGRVRLNETDASGPLAYLEDAVRMLHQGTGNVWLDVSSEEALESHGSVVWCREDVDALAEEWEEAARIKERAYRLIDWLEQDTAHQRLLIDLWQRGVEEAEEDDGSVPEKTAADLGYVQTVLPLVDVEQPGQVELETERVRVEA